MDIQILSDPQEIEDEWQDLWQRDPSATPFQSPVWLLPWRRQFDEGHTLIIAIRKNGRLISLVPLFQHEGRLLLWGAGTSDWLDGVFDPEVDLEALSRSVQDIGEPLDLFQLRSGSPLMHFPRPDGWSERKGTAEICVALPLPAEMSSRMAQNLRYYRRRAVRAGVSEPVLASSACFDELVSLHARRWNARDEPGVLADPRVTAWQREALLALEAAGLLRLYVLRLGQDVVAALLAFISKGRFFYYIGGFDPQHAALGLGTLLVGHAIAEAEREDAQSFDFLRGQESYKYRWGGRDSPTYARHLYPPRVHR